MRVLWGNMTEREGYDMIASQFHFSLTLNDSFFLFYYVSLTQRKKENLGVLQSNELLSQKEKRDQ